MAFNNFNLVEVLKQFTKKQKIFVLVFILGIISVTTILTTYFTTQCKDIMKVNELLREDITSLQASIIQNQEVIARCQAYNEILIHNNLLIIEKTNELHLRLMGSSSLMESQSLTVLPDSSVHRAFPQLKQIKIQPRNDEEIDNIIHDIINIATNPEKNNIFP